MKSMIVVALALVAVALALPVQDQAEPVKIIKSELVQNPDGGYKLSVETDDGTSRTEEGKVIEVLDEENKSHKVVVVRGSYTYTNPDGVQDTVTYVADQNGYQAQGPSIPQPPARR